MNTMKTFVSYKSEDRQAVAVLVDALREVGLAVWWDQDIRSGSPWEESIHMELIAAGCVLVCWTARSVDPHLGAKVQVEAREALDGGKLVQVVLDDVKPPLFFRQYQAKDLRNWSGLTTVANFKAIVEAIRFQLASPLGESAAVRYRFATWGNVRRLISASVHSTLVIAVMLGAVFSATLGFSKEVRGELCELVVVPILCRQPYSTNDLPADVRKMVGRVDEIVGWSERSAMRASESAAKGRAAAASASKGAPGTMIIETDAYIYSGESTDALPQTGYGVKKYKKGESVDDEFAGEFGRGVRLMGVYYYAPVAANTVGVDRYEGRWAPHSRNTAGDWNGNGVVVFRGGRKYIGEVKDGQLEGFGRMVDVGGKRTDGVWKNFSLIESSAVVWSKSGQLQRIGE